MNRYLCTIPVIILGLASAFLVATFLTDLTDATIIAIVLVIVIYLIFSSVSLTCVIFGRRQRILRTLHDRNGLKDKWDITNER